MSGHAHRTILAFDHGRSRIGVAVGQELGATTRPLVTLAARDGQPDWEAIVALVSEWQPDLLVVGLSRHADGGASAVTRAAAGFARRLAARTGLPVEFVDERLSSHAALERLQATGQARRARRDPGLIDQAAAACILDTWFLEHRS